MHGTGDALLNTERGIVLAERGSLDQAEAGWRTVLEDRPLYPPAFTNLASLVIERKDAIAAAQLVDDALRHEAAHPDVLRRAIQLSSRRSRVASDGPRVWRLWRGRWSSACRRTRGPGWSSLERSR